MDIFGFLKRDHKEMSDLLIKLQGTSKRASKARRRLFDQLGKEIDLHTRLEETYFYAVLEQWQEFRDTVNLAFQEHDSVKQLFLELTSLEISDRRWDEKLERLDARLRKHMEEEEQKLFPIARKNIDDMTALELGRQILEEKKEFLIEM
jgi:hemerythrin-like domain-containing protein